MNAISPTNLTPFFFTISKTPFAERLIALATKYFGLGQGIACFGYGAKELIFDGIIKNYKLAALGENPSWLDRTIHKIRSIMVILFQAHGALYVLSAMASVGSELHHLNFINLGPIQPAVKFSGNILFLGACALAIGSECLLIKEAANLEKGNSEEGKEAAKCLKTSAGLGIGGNIFYIISVGSLMVGGGPMLAAVFGVIAISIGGIKMIYDYRRLEPSLATLS